MAQEPKEGTEKLVSLGGFGLGEWTHGIEDVPAVSREPKKVSAATASELGKAAEAASISLVVEAANDVVSEEASGEGENADENTEGE